MDDRELYQLAVKARERSYSPYSRFRVGAALLAMDGGVYMGANIENASYGAANCAERTAFFKAVNEGVRGFEAIAIAGGPEDADVLEFCPPCGICRQVMIYSETLVLLSRTEVMRAAMAAKILTFFIVFLATIMVASSFLSGFLAFRRWRSP